MYLVSLHCLFLHRGFKLIGLCRFGYIRDNGEWETGAGGECRRHLLPPPPVSLKAERRSPCRAGEQACNGDRKGYVKPLEVIPLSSTLRVKLGSRSVWLKRYK